MKQNEDAAPESLPTEAMTQAFARVFDVRDQAGTFGPALRAALTAVGRAPMQQDSDLDPGPTPGDLAGVAPAEVVPATSCVAIIDEDTIAYHNEAWTLNPPFKRSPRPE